jgi:hypothetical protein
MREYIYLLVKRTNIIQLLQNYCTVYCTKMDDSSFTLLELDYILIWARTKSIITARPRGTVFELQL